MSPEFQRFNMMAEKRFHAGGNTDGVWRLHRDIGSEAPAKTAAVAMKRA
jgi:hypothetical protein